ncbi:MAG: phage/plasmid primase, P4 family [Scytonema sp. PMC 1069.18]|nr:phage/plasmid primase, P4 family [Scytonema sp. PMC 1069.18]MEC4881040.1 phage/plasmid primase, P4 family [Scytonema sp. PMC 1070.18]
MSNIANTVADNSSAENTQRAIFVDDSWVYEESRQPKAFQKPILWVADARAAISLSKLFEVVEFDRTEKMVSGEHYLLAEKHTPEKLIKICGWQLTAKGIDCKVYGVNTSLESLLADGSGVSIRETVLLILDYAISFADWEASKEIEQLTTREAVEIAKVAIAHLSEPQKSVELATLRKRCGESSFDWNKLMGSIEEEFALEVRKRKGQEVDNGGTSIDVPAKPKKIPPADVVAQRIAEDYKGKIIYNNEIARWLRYEPDFPGVWSKETDEFVESIVYHVITARGIQGYNSHSYITNIVKSLRNQLIERKWVEPDPKDFIPHRNGVLEVATGKLLPHSPHYRFTWSLPRDYDPTATDWSSINAFLDHLSGNNALVKELLVCYCNAVLKGRYDLQKFLHLIGVGGTGKGTFSRLLIKLIGPENVHNTSLDDWCGNRFEGANAYRKRLVLFPDEERQSGKLGKFLSLTGEDLIRAEEKNKKAFQFRYDGMVLVMSNLPVFTGDSASRVKRRIITVPCNNQVSIFKRRHDKIEQKFDSELSAFTNYILSIPDDRVTDVLLGLVEIPECTLEFWENRTRTDSIAAWLNDWVIYDPLAETAVGNNKDEEISGDPITLYGSYAKHCRRSGSQVKAVKNFSPDLLELCRSVLGWEVEKRVTKTGKFIRGLRLRSPKDNEIPTHDYSLLQRVTNAVTDGSDKLEGLSDKDLTNGDDIALLLSENTVTQELEAPLSQCDRLQLESTEEYCQNTEATEASPNPELLHSEDCEPSPLPSPDLTSEWMSEENLQVMADDLEECEDVEMLKIIKEVYNTEALKVAARRISLGKQKQIRLWLEQLDS